MSGTQNTKTPDDFIKAVEEYFHIKFEFDLAADKNNTKAPKFFTEKQDALNQTWPLNKECWLNPTFRNVGDWIKKCALESDNGCKLKSIWPLSSDLNMIQTYKNADVYIIHGRIWPLVRGCMLCDWSKNSGGKIVGLRWDKKKLIRIW